MSGFALESIATDEIPDVRLSRMGSYVKTESIMSLVKVHRVFCLRVEKKRANTQKTVVFFLPS